MPSNTVSNDISHAINAYISGCVFAANYNFEELVNLYGELFTLHIIN